MMRDIITRMEQETLTASTVTIGMMGRMEEGGGRMEEDEGDYKEGRKEEDGWQGG